MSPPAPLPAVGLTRITRPIPGGLTLSSGLRLTDFSGDSTPSLHALRQGGDKDVAVVVMRENESAMAKKVEDIHRIYG